MVVAIVIGVVLAIGAAARPQDVPALRCDDAATAPSRRGPADVVGRLDVSELWL